MVPERSATGLLSVETLIPDTSALLMAAPLDGIAPASETALVQVPQVDSTKGVLMIRSKTARFERSAVVATSVFVLALAAVASAQKPVTQGASVSETFTIQAIDYQNRLVTLKDSDGNVETVAAGPEVQRFSELKVGDKVTFRYYESVLYAIRKPGQTAPAASGEPSLVRDKGPKPGGTISQQVTASVVIKAIDPSVPSVTVTTDDGQTLSFKIEDKKNIEGVKVGDRVDITYTQALAIRVESPK